jgi:hypothetical protein
MKISKDEADRMVLSVLSGLSKVKNKDFAEQSLKIMDNGYDNAIFAGILLNKATPSIFSEKEIDLQNSVESIIWSFFKTAKQYKWDLIKDGYSDCLVNSFDNMSDDAEDFNQSMKIKFAISQFSSAFLEYERLEEKYPNIMILM